MSAAITVSSTVRLKPDTTDVSRTPSGPTYQAQTPPATHPRRRPSRSRRTAARCARSIGHRRAVDAPRERGVPQLGAGRGVDRMQREIAAAGEHQSARGRHDAGRAGRRRAPAAAPRPCSAGCRRSDGVSPNGTRHLIAPRFRSIATRWPYGGFSSGRPSMNSAFVSPTRVSSASTSDARGFALDRSGFPTRAMFAWFDVLTKSTPLDRIERAAAPVRAADQPGPLHGAAAASAA